MAAPKLLKQVSGVLTEVTPVTTSTADSIPALDGSGKLNTNMMPAGLGMDTATVTASENLAAGDFVNLWTSTGLKARKADATAAGKAAEGFVLAAVTSGNPATVYFQGLNDQCSGLTAGAEEFLTTTAGLPGAAPSGSGNVVQRLGVALSTTSIHFNRGVPITLA